MILPFEDPLVDKKNQVQKRLFEESKGDIRKYRELNEKIAQRVNHKFLKTEKQEKAH
ncbi:MAG: hypothetical protein GF398_04835 [Chitinivibrionales bacterium]|nr:hypothetical protein [Chitinivibrionales bacterium]